MADPKILARVRALLARAVDPGATEEEQRTSAHIAAKLCREHGLNVGELGAEGDGGASQVVRSRAEVVIGGVRTVIETIGAHRPGIESVFGFDVFAFAQELLRERTKEAITETLRKPAPAPRKARRRRKVAKPAAAR